MEIARFERESPRSRANALLDIVPAIIVASVATCIMLQMRNVADFESHRAFAQQMLETGELPVPHPGYEFLLIAARATLPSQSWSTAASVVIASALALTAFVIANATRRTLSSVRWPHVLTRIALPLALLVAQPIQWSVADAWLIGFFPPSQWHNPTTLLSKPAALLLFGAGVTAIAGPVPARGARAILLAAGLTWCSGLIKPSFIIAFLPALLLAGLINWPKTDWKLVTTGFFLPAVLLLGLQYILWFGNEESRGGGVALAPLAVLRHYTPVDLFTLTEKLLRSVAFPAAASVLFFRDALRSWHIRLAWLVFTCGAAVGYLLEETGEQRMAANFVWSGQLAAFVLFVVSAVFLVQRTSEEPRPRALVARAGVPLALLAWHVVSGVRHLYQSWFI